MANEIDFPFPFPPYDVQKEFMKSLYHVLENGKIGILESPTGTGKSLSIICGTLKWLKDFQEKNKKELELVLNDKSDTSSDNWFNDFLKEQEKRYAVLDAKKEYDFLILHESYIKKLKNSQNSKIHAGRFLETKNAKQPRLDDSPCENDDDFAIENENDDETIANVEKEEKPNILKIYFASRTHSQLAQFLGEIKKSPYKEDVTVTVLGSRVNLCVNDAVSRLKNVSLINEHCMDMQRNKTKKGKKCCPYRKNLSGMEDDILSSIMDIEDIVSRGKELKSCPYYASRNVVPKVELVVLPYNILLHKSTRDAYGIRLKDNIVIIDEAHNLVEALSSMYSTEISGECLEQSFWQLSAYHNSYHDRFSQKNLKYIKWMLSVLESLIDFLKRDHLAKNSEEVSRMTSVADFFNLAGIANVNFFELSEFCAKSLIGHKLNGFTAAKVAKGITPLDDLKKSMGPCVKDSTASFLSQIKKMQSSTLKEKNVETKSCDDVAYRPSAFFTFIEFIKTLTSPTSDARVLFCKAPTLKKSFVKFLNLNPSSHLQDIVDTARSIVLAGGTMQPIAEFTDLFLNAGVVRDRISIFTCGHVIPPENLLAIGFATGPCGNQLDFTYKSRNSLETVRELGSVLFNICSSVQGGVVCFFPSYSYEEFIYAELAKNKVMDSIQKRKTVFREPKLSSDVDKVLSEYAKAISMSKTDDVCNGAILFSIVGGKMSEGINFSDDLGRCIVMVGLPYPNKFSIELKEKILYYRSKGGASAGDVYYNNLCMKAVNQSIGRSIRHRNDFATIVLLDYRYKTCIVKDSLPSWILKSFVFHEKFGPAFFALRKFFSTKK